DGGRAAFAERQVVFRGAPLVAVAFDADTRRVPALQVLDVLREHRTGFVGQGRLIEREEDIAERRLPVQLLEAHLGEDLFLGERCRRGRGRGSRRRRRCWWRRRRCGRRRRLWSGWRGLPAARSESNHEHETKREDLVSPSNHVTENTVEVRPVST